MPAHYLRVKPRAIFCGKFMFLVYSLPVGILVKHDTELESVYEAFSDTEKRLAALGAQYQTAMIVVWTMREAVVVIGLVLAILSSSFTIVLPFAAVAFMGLALKAPRATSFFEKNLDMVSRIS